MKTKKKNKVRIAKSDSINYTFIDYTIPQADSKQKENGTKKKKFVRNTLKDAKTAKTHYKSNSQVPSHSRIILPFTSSIEL